MQNKETKQAKDRPPAREPEEPKQQPSYKDTMANKLDARRGIRKQKK